jgi:hypothetical protein
VVIEHGYKSAGFCGLRDYQGEKIYPEVEEESPVVR